MHASSPPRASEPSVADVAFDAALTAAERRLMAGLTSPPAIQAWLETLRYSPDSFYRCPLRVLRERTAHCFDGALFAAAALRRLGHKPLLLDLMANGRDDEHLLALFREGRCWGALAKSNTTGLRYRDPVYRSVRELAMSYFAQYFNVEREKTLRGYTGPLDLRAFDRYRWLTDDAAADRISTRTEQLRLIVLVDEQQARGLPLIDERSYDAGLLGANLQALYQPKR
ncbi:MAG: hypothetical protein IPL40_00100 [Proteobacteria bacterium]|nr:hypothetical protein [Pseudomonadota bacterium]